MTYNIQTFTEQHLPRILAIENTVFGEDSFPESVFLDLLEQPNVIGMVVTGQLNEIVGYTMLRHAKKESEILTIAVTPNRHRKGVGIYLMKNIIIKMLSIDIKNIFLEVRPSNTPAISLYKKFGAEKVGVRENYYEDEDALVYCLKLSEN
jgi:ribosomal-protein-alanine N-acetyltransferase